MSWAQLEERTNRAALRVFGSAQDDAPAKLGWRNVTGDLVEPGDEVFLDGVSAVATQTVFVMVTPDVPDDVVDQPLSIGQRTWRVADTRADGRGMTLLMLEVAR